MKSFVLARSRTTRLRHWASRFNSDRLEEVCPVYEAECQGIDVYESAIIGIIISLNECDDEEREQQEEEERKEEVEQRRRRRRPTVRTSVIKLNSRHT